MEEGTAAVPVLEREADDEPEAVPLAVDEPDWAETEPEADAEEDAEPVDEPETDAAVAEPVEPVEEPDAEEVEREVDPETEPEVEPETEDDLVREEVPVREVDPVVAAVTLPVAEVRELEPVLLRVLELELLRDVPVLERELELETREDELELVRAVDELPREEELVREEELLVLRREVDEVLPVLLEPALLPQLPNLD